MMMMRCDNSALDEMKYDTVQGQFQDFQKGQANSCKLNLEGEETNQNQESNLEIAVWMNDWRMTSWRTLYLKTS